MFHEVREQETFLKEVRRLIKPDGYFLLVEPVIHITEKQFKESVELGRTVGLKPVSDRKIRLSRAVLFQ
jgi:ubiquinone/menaquinone biosynthesis C-methylase UbiE